MAVQFSSGVAVLFSAPALSAKKEPTEELAAPNKACSPRNNAAVCTALVRGDTKQCFASAKDRHQSAFVVASFVVCREYDSFVRCEPRAYAFATH